MNRRNLLKLELESALVVTSIISIIYYYEFFGNSTLINFEIKLRLNFNIIQRLYKQVSIYSYLAYISIEFKNL